MDVDRTGRIVYRRPLSKKLVFYDMILDDGDVGIELVLKAGDVVSVDQIKDYRDHIKLGDRVEAKGRLESDGHTLQVTSLIVKSEWKHTHPDQPFQPSPIKSVSRNHHGGPNMQQIHFDSHHGNEEPVIPLCKFWVNTGRCPKGDACLYSHSITDGIGQVKTGWVKQRRTKRRQASVDPCDPHSNSAQRKSSRAAVFCQWLVEKFGKEKLCEGMGVLDVAGGRGAVSFELASKHGIPSTIVDPRPQRLSRAQHRVVEQLGSSFKLPEQIQAEFSPELWRKEGDVGEHLRGCSLVVGMHPDQATDAIVDFALEYSKNFAVVPCCVFPRLFPDRKVRCENGDYNFVVTHPQLVEYLKQKTSGQSVFLGFQGMNHVVYRRLE